MNYDLLIVGAGPVGCTIAERAATTLGWTSLIVEKRQHIAGNCYDRYDENGILVHQYGPHYFRTNNVALLNYLSQFTGWISGSYIVNSSVHGQLYPFPINRSTVEQFFGVKLDSESVLKFMESKRIPFESPANSEEFVLSRVGREMYEAFYLGYTLKQWGIHPKDLNASVCGRIPIRSNCDHRYVDHRYQLMPRHGYTKMISNMINSQRIKVLLNTDYREVQASFKPKIATVYCGPIDEYFGFKHGRLGWRSLKFEFVHEKKESVQPSVQINYPNDFDYTRSVEFKHVTKQTHPHTTIAYEYPAAEGDPYYPIPTDENAALFKKYAADAETETKTKKIYFAGRLAQYKYINMDEAFESALKTFDKMKSELSNAGN